MVAILLPARRVLAEHGAAGELQVRPLVEGLARYKEELLRLPDVVTVVLTDVVTDVVVKGAAPGAVVVQ